MGKLVVEVSSQRYESWADIDDENVRRLLLAAIGELVTFAGGYVNLVEAGVAPPGATDPTRDATPSPETEQPSREQQQAAFLAALEAERDALGETPPQGKPSVLRGLRTASAPASPPTAKSELNVVEQIDAILQKLVGADPGLVQRSIHLEQDPSGGLRIEVDGEYFQRPAEIEETRIQIYIKRALEEWESF
jgi:hypothetical protein